MKYLRNIAIKAANTVIRTLTIREPDGWIADSMRSDSGESTTAPTALSLSAVWGCVNLLAGTQASLPIEVFRPDRSGQRVLARDHRLYRILHDSPNFDQTAVDFWEFMAASLELYGNAYARIERNAGAVASLHPIIPDLVKVRRLANGDLEYRWSEEGKSFVATSSEVLHIRGFGGNPLGGLSTLQFARHALGLARAVDRAAGNTFRNGLRPSGVLTFDKFLTADQRKTAHNELLAQFVGAANSGKPMVLEGGTKWEQLTISPEDAQMLESRSFSVEELCRFFGVPPFMIGHTEKVSGWGTSLKEQTIGFQKFVLRRRLKRIEQALMKQLLTAFERANGYVIEFNLEGLLRGDSEARSAFYQSALNNGWMTINEVRALENMPPVAGGDVPRMQMQNVPLTAQISKLPIEQAGQQQLPAKDETR